jgi:hypothetical protein
VDVAAAIVVCGLNRVASGRLESFEVPVVDDLLQCISI